MAAAVKEQMKTFADDQLTTEDRLETVQRTSSNNSSSSSRTHSLRMSERKKDQLVVVGSHSDSCNLGCIQQYSLLEQITKRASLSSACSPPTPTATTTKKKKKIDEDYDEQ